MAGAWGDERSVRVLGRGLIQEGEALKEGRLPGSKLISQSMA